MIKRGFHAAKKHIAAHDTHSRFKHIFHPSRVVPLYSRQPTEMKKENVPPFLAWPSHLFEMLLTSWHDLTPIEAWVENWRVGEKQVFPKTQNIETDKEYFYRVELPGIARKQIALTIQNGVIMLRVEKLEEQRKKGHHYQRARSIRRAFSLPVYTDGKAITAELKDGILTIIIPKTDNPVSPKSHLINIS